MTPASIGIKTDDYTKHVALGTNLDVATASDFPATHSATPFHGSTE